VYPRRRGAWSRSAEGRPACCPASEREFVIDDLLVRIHFIIVMIRWTGLAPWDFEFPFPGSLTSTFLDVLIQFRMWVSGCMDYTVEYAGFVPSKFEGQCGKI